MNSKLKKPNSIKFETESIKSSLCNYSDAFVLFTGDITVTADIMQMLHFAPLSTCKTNQKRLLMK